MGRVTTSKKDAVIAVSAVACALVFWKLILLPPYVAHHIETIKETKTYWNPIEIFATVSSTMVSTVPLILVLTLGLLLTILWAVPYDDIFDWTKWGLGDPRVAQRKRSGSAKFLPACKIGKRKKIAL